MFGQEVQCFSSSLKFSISRPMLVAGALLGFEIVLDVDEQAGLPGALLRLAGRGWAFRRSGRSGPPRHNRRPQGFQSA